MDFSVLEPHLFRNAQLYAPEELGHCDLLIAGGKIVAVEKAGHATTRPDCPESDLAGAVVCPGFIDQHVHLIGGGGEAGPHTRTPEVRLSALVAAGITSVVGLLGTDGVTRHPESLLAKTRALEHEGISTWMLTGAYGLPSPTITGSIEKDVALIDKIIGLNARFPTIALPRRQMTSSRIWPPSHASAGCWVPKRGYPCFTSATARNCWSRCLTS